MTSEYKKQDKLLILKITEEIDHHTSEKIRKRADYEIQIHIPKKVIFDFENVTFMDSSGIGMIIGRYKLVTMFRRNCIVNKCQTSCKERYLREMLNLKYREIKESTFGKKNSGKSY